MKTAQESLCEVNIIFVPVINIAPGSSSSPPPPTMCSSLVLESGLEDSPLRVVNMPWGADPLPDDSQMNQQQPDSKPWQGVVQTAGGGVQLLYPWDADPPIYEASWGV